MTSALKTQADTSKGGRPRKFTEPSRPITVTLPERVLIQLAAIDSDRARAIVKAVDATMATKTGGPGGVTVVEVSRGAGLIVIGPSKYVRRIPWLRLVEIAPTRFLLSVPSGTAVDSLEVALVDVLDTVPAAEKGERALLQHLVEIIRSMRRSQKMTKGEILFVNTAH